MKEESNLWLDRIKLSALVLIKECSMIEVYSNLIKSLRSGKVPVSEAMQCADYNGCWNIAHELYTFMEFNKIQDLLDKPNNDDVKDEIDELTKIMKKYTNLGKEVNIDELFKVVPILCKIVSLSGYHNDSFKNLGGDIEDEEY